MKNAISISERSTSVEDRAVPGHWEGDLIAGSRNSQVATQVERQSRYVILIKFANRGIDSVLSTLIKRARKSHDRIETPGADFGIHQRWNNPGWLHAL